MPVSEESKQVVRRVRPENLRRWRLENWLLGGTVLFWSVVQFLNGTMSSPVRLAMLSLNLCVGVLIVTRSAARNRGNWRLILAALPSVGMGFLSIKLAPQPTTWPAVAQATFVVGCVIAISAFCFLGRSFAVLPSVRSIVAKGPYRWLRHPAYFGELLLAAACFLAAPSAVTSVPLVLAVPLTVIRINVEEQLLRTEPDYVAYSNRTRWRLIPFVW